MCQGSFKYIEPNGWGNDLKIASFSQNVAFWNSMRISYKAS